MFQSKFYKYFRTLSIILLINQLKLSKTIFTTNSEHLILLPSVAFRSDSSKINASRDDWIINIQGWYFKESPFRTTLATSMLSTIIDDIDSERVSYLTASGRSHRNLCFHALKYDLCGKTDKFGLFHKDFKVTNTEIKEIRSINKFNEKIDYSVSSTDKNVRSNGEIFLCDDNGISIISDIDDTIKITGVTNVRLILKNTFTGEYKSVPGMSQRYRHYQSLYNATYHYLTASPDQLYPFLRDFLDQESFPLGSFHMRHFTWLDSNFFRFFLSSSFIEQKTNILEMFFQKTRARKFILFGDIFQKDPEIYADIYQKYPNAIIKIFIRVPKSKTKHRLKQVFKTIPDDKWTTFTDGFDLPDRIF